MSASARSKVLFISGVLPDRTGSGAFQRAHQWVNDLREQHQVHILLLKAGDAGSDQRRAAVESAMPEVVFHHVGIYSRTPRWLRFATILLPSSQTLVSRLQKVSGVEYLGEWNEVGPLYQAADIALVPPRGGGSTKLKLLETVAYARRSLRPSTW